MSGDRLFHIRITGEPTQSELAEVRDLMEDALEDFEGNGKIVVSDERMSIGEVPALDEYADELADRIVKRLNA